MNETDPEKLDRMEERGYLGFKEIAVENMRRAKPSGERSPTELFDSVAGSGPVQRLLMDESNSWLEVEEVFKDIEELNRLSDESSSLQGTAYKIRVFEEPSIAKESKDGICVLEPDQNHRIYVAYGSSKILPQGLAHKVLESYLKFSAEQFPYNPDNPNFNKTLIHLIKSFHAEPVVYAETIMGVARAAQELGLNGTYNFIKRSCPELLLQTI